MLVRHLAALLFVAPLLRTQGTGPYFNVESPQLRPLAIATVAGRDYIAACNTPDNSVEFYDTVGNTYLGRARVGAEPVTVRWNAALSRLYVCNFLGDSITIVRLDAPGIAGPLRATVETTVHVGNEPMDVAFLPDNQSLFVSLNSESAFGWRLSTTLAPVIPNFSERIDLADAFFQPTMAIREPRCADVVGGRLFFLGHRGGRVLANGPVYDFDLWSLDFADFIPRRLGNLGTTNFNMAFARNGDLWVVGTEAQIQTRGEANVKLEPTGFVKSLLFRIRSPGTATPTVVSRDLNLTSGASPVPVQPGQSLAHPTDVALFEPQGTLQKVFVAAFNSDRLGVVVPNGSPSSWAVRRIEAMTAPNSTNPSAGPRALAIKYANPAVPNDPGARLYVLNRLDNSIGVVDPAAETWLTTFALRNDPTPEYIRKGRQFLYSAKLSGNGFDACASCHVDGRSDWLAWDLSSGATQPFARHIFDGVPNPLSSEYPANKEFLVTQSLQGLATHETNSDVQTFFSTEPLHWRADKSSFTTFNAAYVNLMGRPNLGTPADPKGVTDQEMAAFRDFVFSVSYPPNPNQPLDRVHTGSFGTPNRLDDGSAAQRGLKLFLGGPITLGGEGSICQGRSCVQCHALPAGTNLHITEFSATNGSGNQQPLEAPSLRLLTQKDALLERNANPFPSNSLVVTGLFGLEHQGIFKSTNVFNVIFGRNFNVSQLTDLTQFLREFDSGIGPAVGISYSVDPTNVGQPFTLLVLDVLEGQARKANHGLVAQAWIGGRERGFWLDITGAPPGVWREEPGPLGLSRAGLLSLVAARGDLIVFQATPLGSERRFASTSGGTPAPLTGPSPTNISFEPMVPSTQWENVPLVTRNWAPGTGPLDFNWTGSTPTPPTLRTLRIFQHALGVPPRHDAPRRFQVAGDNLRHGARLLLYMAANPARKPPYPNNNWTVPFLLPLYPTDRFNSAGKRIWQTSVEATPLIYYVMMLGGPAAPNVISTLDGDVAEPPPPGTFDPAGWNLYWVWVFNADGTFGTAGWQPLKI